MSEETDFLQQQIEATMPLVGKLLDVWDEAPNDVKYDEELEPIRKVIERINIAMEGD